MVYRDEMYRRKFALSWGRKLFFGISWPLSSILSLLYFKAFVLPETSSELIYIVLTFIGHFGLLNVIVYFLIYSPLTLLMPTYYVTRIWSLLLILGVNSFILFDALSFSVYHLHIYSYISQLFMRYGFQHLIGADSGLNIFIGALVILSIFIWIRGEVMWRYMQGRFSNPVKNWYIILIFLCTALSKALYHYGEINPKIADIFPLNYNFSRVDNLYSDNRKFYYPSEDLNCQNINNPNLILIIIKNWNREDLNPELMPVTFHIKEHSSAYNYHLGVSKNVDDGIYSLLYSLPASYKSVSEKKLPAFKQEMAKRQYEMLSLTDDDQNLNFSTIEGSFINKLHNWAVNRPTEDLKPFYISLFLNGESTIADNLIHKFVIQLQKENLLENTHILITGAFSGASSSYVPLIWSAPDRKSHEFNHLTSHYDVMPTLMQKIWGCKKSFQSASVGKSLDVPLKDWVLLSGNDELEILDLENDTKIYVANGQITDTGKKSRHELIFSALKLKTKFMRPN